MGTRFNLDAGKVILDYKELETVASFAIFYGIQAIERHISGFHDGKLSATEAEFFLKDAERLSRAITARYYLSKGSNREEKILV